MNLTNYLDQHKEIEIEMKTIQTLLTGSVEENAEKIAKHMCQLAGKIKVHLSSEDTFMYPQLSKSEEESVRTLATRYQQQMGGIAEKFVAYKEKYNTKQKVLQNSSMIKAETNIIFREIENRVQKEESELYKYI